MIFFELIFTSVVVFFFFNEIRMRSIEIQSGILSFKNFYHSEKNEYFIVENSSKDKLVLNSLKGANRSYQDLLERIAQYANSVLQKGIEENKISKYIDDLVNPALEEVEDKIPSILYVALQGTVTGIIVTFISLVAQLTFSQSEENWDNSIKIISLGVALTMSITFFALLKLISLSEAIRKLRMTLSLEQRKFLKFCFEALPKSAEVKMENNLAKLSQSFDNFSKVVLETQNNVEKQQALVHDLAKVDFGKISESVLAFANIFPDLEKFRLTSQQIVSFIETATPKMEQLFTEFNVRVSSDLAQKEIGLKNSLDKYEGLTAEHVDRISSWVTKYNQVIAETVEKQNSKLSDVLEKSKPQLEHLEKLSSIETKLETLTNSNQWKEIFQEQTSLMKSLLDSIQGLKSAVDESSKKRSNANSGNGTSVAGFNSKDFWDFIRIESKKLS